MNGRLAVIPAVAAIAATAVILIVTGARAAASFTQTWHIFDKPKALTLTRSNGDVISRPPR